MRSLLVSALAVAGLAGMAQAQTAPGKVGVVNLQSAIIGTKDGQKAAAEMETKFAPTRQRVQQQQAELNQLQEQMRKGSNTMAEQARLDLQRNIDEKTKRLNRDMQDAQEELNQEQQRLLQSLGQRLMSVLEQYAKEHGFSMVLDVSSPNTPVLYASTGVEITQEVIALYDKSAPAATTTAAPSAAKPAPVRPAATPPATHPAAAPATPPKK